jgi:hypothetical protein
MSDQLRRTGFLERRCYSSSRRPAEQLRAHAQNGAPMSTTTHPIPARTEADSGPLPALDLAPYQWREHQISVQHRICRAEDYITQQLFLLLSVTSSIAVREPVVRALIASLPQRLKRRVLVASPLHALRCREACTRMSSLSPSATSSTSPSRTSCGGRRRSTR